MVRCGWEKYVQKMGRTTGTKKSRGTISSKEKGRNALDREEKESS